VRRATKDVSPPSDLEVAETGILDDDRKLCFQQSAGHSTLPEIDVAPGVLRDRFLHTDVGDLQPASWLEDAIELGEDGRLVGAKIRD
jgi:hypothetical protein